MDNSRLDRPVNYIDDTAPVFVELDAEILKDQPQVVIFNIAGPQQRPRNDHAAIRLLGFFNTMQDAKHHCDIHYPESGLFNAIHACAIGQNVVLAPSFELQYDEKHTSNTIEQQVSYARDKIMARHKAHCQRLASAKRTASNTEAETVAPSSPSTCPVKEDARNAGVASTAAVPIHNQSVAVIGVLQGAPGVDTICTVYGVFQKIDEATDFIRNVIGVYVIDRPLYVVDCYSWLYTHVLLKKKVSREEWRNEKESMLMRTQQTQHAASVAYRTSHGFSFNDEKAYEMDELHDSASTALQ